MMRKSSIGLGVALGMLAGVAGVGPAGWAAPAGPAFDAGRDAAWRLAGEVAFPDVKSGPYSDYVTTDTRRHRVFTTMQASKEVVVSDYESDKVIKVIPGFGNPHGVVYRGDTDRLYVSDGAGKIEVYDGASYAHLKTIALRPGVDGVVYDPQDKRRIYVANGGDDAGEATAHLSVIDTDLDRVVADWVFPTPVLEQGVIDHAEGRMYLNLPMKAALAVIDLKSGRIAAQWAVPSCGRNMSVALSRAWNRLFVACRNSSMRGVIVVFDLKTGAVSKVLPSRGWIDSLWLDEKRRRIVDSSGDGVVETYVYTPDDAAAGISGPGGRSGGQYRKADDVETSVMAKTSYFDPVADRLFVSVPHLGFPTDYAKVMIFRPVE
ncbi:hypothetical protein HUK84_08280 [Nguyenibacter vanlangensis]|uniref:DNA-binding beta-propeller fold protein YncE n=2 Tax=Nguyenibacter vanlangensis TaxID=1216886 RepID=A0A7Y7IVJ1_9PROT|nr:hypothetical protein [Nguyenibacter vanlangensis]